MLKSIRNKVCELICDSHKKQKEKFTPLPIDRIRAFFNFCDGLEDHPFFKNHKAGGMFEVSGDWNLTGFSSKQNFDSIHLESLLTRLRQFLFERELFFFKDLRRDLKDSIGIDSSFDKFYGQFNNNLNEKFKRTNVQFFYSDGKEAITGRTFKQLVEDRLYRGAIHSQNLLQFPTPSPHAAMASHIDMTLAFSSMRIIQNILNFRMWILKMARDYGKVSACPELIEFDKRCVAAGC